MQLTLSVPRAGQILGLGRAAAYEAAKRGEIPIITMGRRKLVPVRALEEMLKLEPGTLTERDFEPDEATSDNGSAGNHATRCND